MTAKLNINMDEFEKWLTPELLETAFYNAGFDVELKEEFKSDFESVSLKEKPKNVQVKIETEHCNNERFAEQFKISNVGFITFTKIKQDPSRINEAA